LVSLSYRISLRNATPFCYRPSPTGATRDVALAHILATKEEHGGKRFIMSSPKPVTPEELAEITRKAHPNLFIVDLGEHKLSSLNDVFCSKNYASMQQPLRPYAESIRDMAGTMLANGSVRPKYKGIDSGKNEL
jgi:hypothetical protein